MMHSQPTSLPSPQLRQQPQSQPQRSPKMKKNGGGTTKARFRNMILGAFPNGNRNKQQSQQQQPQSQQKQQHSKKRSQLHRRRQKSRNHSRSVDDINFVPTMIQYEEQYSTNDDEAEQTTMRRCYSGTSLGDVSEITTPIIFSTENRTFMERAMEVEDPVNFPPMYATERPAFRRQVSNHSIGTQSINTVALFGSIGWESTHGGRRNVNEEGNGSRRSYRTSSTRSGALRTGGQPQRYAVDIATSHHSRVLPVREDDDEEEQQQDNHNHHSQQQHHNQSDQFDATEAQLSLFEAMSRPFFSTSLLHEDAALKERHVSMSNHSELVPISPIKRHDVNSMRNAHTTTTRAPFKQHTDSGNEQPVQFHRSRPQQQRQQEYPGRGGRVAHRDSETSSGSDRICEESVFAHDADDYDGPDAGYTDETDRTLVAEDEYLVDHSSPAEALSATSASASSSHSQAHSQGRPASNQQRSSGKPMPSPTGSEPSTPTSNKSKPTMSLPPRSPLPSVAPNLHQMHTAPQHHETVEVENLTAPRRHSLYAGIEAPSVYRPLIARQTPSLSQKRRLVHSPSSFGSEDTGRVITERILPPASVRRSMQIANRQQTHVTGNARDESSNTDGSVADSVNSGSDVAGTRTATMRATERIISPRSRPRTTVGACRTPSIQDDLISGPTTSAPTSPMPQRRRRSNSCNVHDRRMPSIVAIQQRQRTVSPRPSATRSLTPPSRSIQPQRTASATATTSATTTTTATALAPIPSIEVAPGVMEPLRPADEMYRAMTTGNVMPTSCFACNLELMSLDDAKYILCPDCRVVSPIRMEYDFGQKGVALGVKSHQYNAHKNKSIAMSAR